MFLISKEQLEELEEARSTNRERFNDLLEKRTGIVAKPYTGYVYYDDAGNWVGDSDDYTVRELLQNAYIGVRDDAQ